MRLARRAFDEEAMFSRKRQQTPDEHVDRVAKAVVRSGGISDDDTEAIASSPFLYSRLRARIEAEQRRRAGPRAGWFTTLLVAPRAIPALVLIAIMALGVFWLTKINSAVGLPYVDVRNDNIGRVLVGGTCALSSTEECAISNEEVLATLFAEGDAQR
jgi:hypothetical protein